MKAGGVPSQSIASVVVWRAADFTGAAPNLQSADGVFDHDALLGFQTVLFFVKLAEVFVLAARFLERLNALYTIWLVALKACVFEQAHRRGERQFRLICDALVMHRAFDGIGDKQYLLVGTGENQVLFGVSFFLPE
jgi:triacylglycerol esterase/lipase EstA (alpha/beta hydrolase family)